MPSQATRHIRYTVVSAVKEFADRADRELTKAAGGRTPERMFFYSLGKNSENFVFQRVYNLDPAFAEVFWRKAQKIKQRTECASVAIDELFYADLTRYRAQRTNPQELRAEC